MTQAALDRQHTTVHRSPPLLLLAVVFAVLFIASLVGSIAMAGGAHYPSPYQPEDLSRVYFVEHADAVRLSSFLQFGAAIPLGLFTAVCASRLRFFGLDVAGVDIALFGGFTASTLAAISALINWTISWPEVAASDAVHPLHVAAFAAGGPGHVVPFGLLVAGVSVAAGLSRRLPKWLMWFGLVIALLAELSVFSMVLYPASYLLPGARVLGLVWIICVGAILPKARSTSEEKT